MVSGGSPKRRRPAAQSGWVSEAWAGVVAGAEAGRARRGRQWARQGAVTQWRLEADTLCAVVKGNGLPAGGVEVRLPRIRSTEFQQQMLANLLADRPDWLASMLANVWSPGVQEALMRSEISLFPDTAQVLAKAECTCGDPARPCAHMAAVAYRWLAEVQSSPLQALEYVDIERQSLLERTHQCSMAVPSNVGASILNEDTACKDGWTQAEYPSIDGLWLEERAVLWELIALDGETSLTCYPDLRHTLDPEWQTGNWKAWRVRYLAWRIEDDEKAQLQT